MWCSRCQQDVPALFGKSASGQATCARCGRGVGLQGSAPNVRSPSVKSPLDLSDWKLEDDLREAQRLVRLIQSRCDDEPAIDEGDGDNCRDDRPGVAPAATSSAAAFGWLLFACGLSGVVCGCALLAWSLYSGRGELWNIGLPVALVSQAVLACGLVLQFDGRARATVESQTSVAAPAPTHLHVNAGSGLHAAGLSVHFSTTPQVQAMQTSRAIKQQVDAALKRRAA